MRVCPDDPLNIAQTISLSGFYLPDGLPVELREEMFFDIGKLTV